MAYDISLIPRLTALQKTGLVEGSEGIGECPWRRCWDFRISLFFLLPGWHEVKHFLSSVPFVMLWCVTGLNDGMSVTDENFWNWVKSFLFCILGTFSQWQKYNCRKNFWWPLLGCVCETSWLDCEDLLRTRVYLKPFSGYSTRWLMTYKGGLIINVYRMNMNRWTEGW